MLELPQVTLISLAGIDFDATVEAMLTCQRDIKFAESKIVSPSRPSNLTRAIQWEKSPPLRLRSPGIDDYSFYCLYNLWKHVNTDFCLVVQADGYVLNAKKWSQTFLEYDYIGAPWQIHDDAFVDPFGNHQRVGNGGFSLRSRKLLTVPLSHHVEFEVNRGDFYNHMGENLLHEDGNICVHNRHVYEGAGCKFAPVEVAVHFAQEHFVPEARWVRPFGFHRSKPRLGRRFLPW